MSQHVFAKFLSQCLTCYATKKAAHLFIENLKPSQVKSSLDTHHTTELVCLKEDRCLSVGQLVRSCLFLQRYIVLHYIVMSIHVCLSYEILIH
ncbi:unnamed protein product [Arctogadus glacialis]